MNSKKIGEYISTLRKKNYLTQMELADQLGVTDKAVSKWERGAGYPDISLLQPLSEALGISINELLEGEDKEKISPEKEEDKTDKEDIEVTNALAYADKIIKMKEHKKGKLASAILAISLFVAIFVCVIVNIAVDHRLSWSYIVISSCVLGGCLLIPPLLINKKGFLISLSFLTILIMPFLASLQYIIKAEAYAGTEPQEWLWSLAFPVSLTWLLFAWLMVIVYRVKKFNWWFIGGIVALLCIPAQAITNTVIDEYVYTLNGQVIQDYSTEATIIVLIAIFGICFVFGLMRNNKKQEINRSR